MDNADRRNIHARTVCREAGMERQAPTRDRTVWRRPGSRVPNLGEKQEQFARLSGEWREDGRRQRRPAASAVFSIQLPEGRPGTAPAAAAPPRRRCQCRPSSRPPSRRSTPADATASGRRRPSGFGPGLYGIQMAAYADAAAAAETPSTASAVKMLRMRRSFMVSFLAACRFRCGVRFPFPVNGRAVSPSDVGAMPNRRQYRFVRNRIGQSNTQDAKGRIALPRRAGIAAFRTISRQQGRTSYRSGTGSLSTRLLPPAFGLRSVRSRAARATGGRIGGRQRGRTRVAQPSGCAVRWRGNRGIRWRPPIRVSIATALEFGAPDYIARPISPTEPVTRAHAAHRHRKAPKR